MLRAVLNINQNVYVTNKHLYGGLPGLSEKVAARRMRLVIARDTASFQQAGAMGTNTQALIKRTTDVDILLIDVGAESPGKLARCMEDREDWKLVRGRPREREEKNVAEKPQITTLPRC